MFSTTLGLRKPWQMTLPTSPWYLTFLSYMSSIHPYSKNTRYTVTNLERLSSSGMNVDCKNSTLGRPLGPGETSGRPDIHHTGQITNPKTQDLWKQVTPIQARGGCPNQYYPWHFGDCRILLQSNNPKYRWPGVKGVLNMPLISWLHQVNRKLPHSEITNHPRLCLLLWGSTRTRIQPPPPKYYPTSHPYC